MSNHSLSTMIAVCDAMVGAKDTERVLREIRPAVIRGLDQQVASSRDEYVELLKNVALSISKKAVLAMLVPALPSWMTTGFIGALFNPLLGFLVGIILELAIRETELGMFFLYIDLRTSAEGRAFEMAARENLDKQKYGTPEQKEKSEKELIDAFKAFVKLTN